MPTENKKVNDRIKKKTKEQKYFGVNVLKPFRRFRKNGVIIMFVIMGFYALFVSKPSGYTFFEGMMGKATKMAHSTMTVEQASDIKILIDAGHGGFDNGAVSDYTNKTESQLNLEVAQKLKEELKQVGFQVEMTRDDSSALGDDKNSDMKNREALIYKSKADLLVSVHMNTHQDKSVNGPIVFYMPGSNRGNEVAALVQESMNDELDPKSPKNAQAQNFMVLRAGNMPGILVECGFISNRDEAGKLSKDYYQKRIAKSISWGIIDYFAESA